MSLKNLKLFLVATLLLGLASCSDSDNNNGGGINPPQEKTISVDHSAGLWSANVTDLPRKATDKSSAYISKVYDFLPANGQFVNDLPKYTEGDTKADMLKKVNTALVGEKPSMISLGGFGGYVVFGFDHTVENRPGLRDLRILGNAFENNAEPGIIMVSYDVNGNGLPDDPWFEIRGSEYDKAVKNYTFTMYNPDKADWEVTDENHIKWEDSLGESGFISKNAFHKQPYFPQWIDAEKISFRGNRLPNNAVQDGIWKLPAFEFGYADNVSNSDDESAIDIDWAVDANGEFVHLPGIDFVKVYTGQFQDAGWLGETSSEVAGAIDLHVKGEVIETRKQPLSFKDGYFIVNEDWFGHSNGSVNFISNAGVPTYRAYQKANEAETFGVTTTYGTIHGDQAYFVSKQGNRLVAADRYSLKKEAVLTEIGGDGRAFVGVTSNKGYVSTSNGVSVIDLNGLKLTKTIEGLKGEFGNMVHSGKYVFATSTGGNVVVIDAETDAKHTELNFKATDVVKDGAGNVWFGGAKLIKVNPETLEIVLEQEIDGATFRSNRWAWTTCSLQTNREGTILYWASGKSVVSYDIASATLNKNLYTLSGSDLAKYDKTAAANQQYEFYGAGLGVNPANNELLLLVKRNGFGDSLAYNWVVNLNNNGSVKKVITLLDDNSGVPSEVKDGGYYWCPSCFMFQN